MGVSTINVLSKNKKNITIFHLKIIFFTAVKNCSVLHGRVFVMQSIGSAAGHAFVVACVERRFSHNLAQLEAMVLFSRFLRLFQMET